MKWNCLIRLAGKRLPAVLLIGGMVVGSVANGAQLTESDVLAALAGKEIRPVLAKVTAASRELTESARLLCERRDAEQLKKAQMAWKEAYLAWRAAQPLMLQGKESQAERFLENWPANEVVLDGATGAQDLAPLLKNVDVRGFSGAEYLLFAPAGAAEATTEGRCAHLQGVAAEIADQAVSNQRYWERASGPFVAAGDGQPFLLPGDALSLVFARMLNVTERLLRDRLCAPSGFFEGAARPVLLEAWRSNSTRQSFRATVNGLRRALIGDGTGGITALVAVKDGLVSKRNPRLAADIRKQFAVIEKRLDDLDDGLLLYKGLQRKESLLRPLYKSIEKLQEQIVEASLTLEVNVIGPGEAIM